MVLEYAVHIQARNQCRLRTHRFFFFFSSGVAWTQLSYKRGCKFRAGTHLMCLLLFFFSTACKVEAPGHTKTLYHNVCKLNSCHFFQSAFIYYCSFVVGFFFSFFFLHCHAILDRGTDVSRTAPGFFFFFFCFHLREGGRQLFWVELCVSVVLK